MKNLNMELRWKILIPLGICLHFIGFCLQDKPFAPAIKMIGDFIWILGLVYFTISKKGEQKKKEVVKIDFLGLFKEHKVVIFLILIFSLLAIFQYTQYIKLKRQNVQLQETAKEPQIPKFDLLEGIDLEESEPVKTEIPQQRPVVSDQSQILQDQANKALLNDLQEKDFKETMDTFMSFNDAWRENPEKNCRNSSTYNYDIAQLVVGILEDKMTKNYGTSLNWRAATDLAFKHWCLDRGY